MVPQTHTSSRFVAAKTDERPPLSAFVGWACVAGVAVTLLFYALPQVPRFSSPSIVAAGAFYAFAVVVAAVGFVRTYPHARLGLCNMVTLIRLAMVAVFVAVLVAGAPQSWTLVGFAIATLALDGVDGWLARRQGLASSFGARFDMEVDAVFALVLAVLAFSNGVAGVFVLFLGLPSYLFFGAKFIFPWLAQPLPDLLSRKVVCVAQLGVLIALQLPLDLGGALGVLALATVVALLWSFGRDILWLARTQK